MTRFGINRVEPDGSRALLITKTWWANAAVYSV